MSNYKSCEGISATNSLKWHTSIWNCLSVSSSACSCGREINHRRNLVIGEVIRLSSIAKVQENKSTVQGLKLMLNPLKPGVSADSSPQLVSTAPFLPRCAWMLSRKLVFSPSVLGHGAALVQVNPLKEPTLLGFLSFKLFIIGCVRAHISALNAPNRPVPRAGGQSSLASITSTLATSGPSSHSTTAPSTFRRCIARSPGRAPRLSCPRLYYCSA